MENWKQKLIIYGEGGELFAKVCMYKTGPVQ